MEQKKALLVVAGGRATPDVLSLFYVQPNVVVYLTSEQGWNDEQAFVSIAEGLPTCENIRPIRNVNAYKFDEALQACRDACNLYPETDWEWIFAISSAPKVTGIAAYEVAKEKNVPCLYINTQDEEIVSLVKDVDKATKNLFHMSVQEYMTIQCRKRKELKETEILYRNTVEKWSHIAVLLALSPLTPSFIKVMHDKKANDDVLLKSNFISTSTFVQELENLSAIRIKRNEEETTCSFTSSFYAKFIGTGDWLEVYVWNEVKKAMFASDCQWGYEMVSTANNELDVALTHKAQLIFVECKTENEPFTSKTHHLDTISTKAAMIGGSYVTKVFVTNEPSSHNGYSNFANQAALRKIVVATQEDLPNIGQILKREALTPTYPMI